MTTLKKKQLKRLLRRPIGNTRVDVTTGQIYVAGVDFDPAVVERMIAQGYHDSVIDNSIREDLADWE